MPMMVKIRDAMAKITFLLNFIKSRLFEWFDFEEFFRLYARTAKVRNNLLASRICLVCQDLIPLFQSHLVYDLQTQWTMTAPIACLAFQIQKTELR